VFKEEKRSSNLVIQFRRGLFNIIIYREKLEEEDGDEK
jgi:hypothetical protein